MQVKNYHNIFITLVFLFLFIAYPIFACSPGSTNVCADGTIQTWTPGGFSPPCGPSSAGNGVSIGNAFKISEANGSRGVGNLAQFNSIGILLSSLLPNVFVIAGVIIFFFIILGGFTMITSAGNPEKQKEGSAMITGAVMGFVIIFGAYWIVQLLEWILGVSILNPGGI